VLLTPLDQHRQSAGHLTIVSQKHLPMEIASRQRHGLPGVNAFVDQAEAVHVQHARSHHNLHQAGLAQAALVQAKPARPAR
jgi:hypothetical protein